MGKSQEQAPGNEKYRKNQALFRKYTSTEGAPKNLIIMVVEPVFLYPLVDQLTGFGQVSALTMIQHLLSSYGAIEKSTSRKTQWRWWDPTTRRTPCLIYWTIGKGERIRARRREIHLWYHDDVQRDHTFVADRYFQRQHPWVETSDHGPEDMGKIQAVLPPIKTRAEKSGNNLRKRRVNWNGAKHIWCTASHSGRVSRDYIRNLNNCERYANKELRAGRTITSQCIPYQI